MLKTQTNVHSYIAAEILKSKDADLHRAFTMWLDLRSHGNSFLFSEILSKYSELTGKDERTVRRWLDSGIGMFWDIGKKHSKKGIYLIGAKKLMQKLNLPIPGRVILIDRKDLFGGLQKLRAALSTVWMNGKEKKFASRETIEKLIGKTSQTQLNYEKLNGQKKQSNITYDIKSEYAAFRQLPNLYYASNYAKHIWQKKLQHRYGFFSVGIQTWKNRAENLKVYFSTVECGKRALKDDRTEIAFVPGLQIGIINVLV